MKFVPHDYQRRAIDFVIEHPASLLALQMGLGKSAITLTAAALLMEEGEVSKVLVVAPKKVAETTWSDEAAKWDHLRWLRVAKVMGTEKQRLQVLQEEADVYVIGRDSFAWLVGRLGGLPTFDMLVIDELTSFKSPRSERFRAMRMSRPGVPRVVGLTGTPAPNGLIDLWAQMWCIDMGERLGKYVTRYREAYFSTYTVNHIPVRCTPKPGAEDTIMAKIGDITLTMQTKDYLELPPLLERTEKVTLPPAVLARYREFEKQRVMEFAAANADKPAQVVAASAAALMAKLAQFAAGAVYDDAGGVQEIHGEKIARLAEIVEAASSPVLVFYQFRHDIPRIEKKLKGLRVVRYEGGEDLREWNAGRVDVLLAHPASTAYGLNMQAGGHIVVWYGTGWNLELYQQANARLHRQGQKNPVTVYRLACTDTVDERACAAIEGKKTVQQGLMDGLSDLMRKYNLQKNF